MLPLGQSFKLERYHENPLNIIVESFIALETWFDTALIAHGIDVRLGIKKLGGSEIADLDLYKGILSRKAGRQ